MFNDTCLRFEPMQYFVDSLPFDLIFILPSLGEETIPIKSKFSI